MATGTYYSDNTLVYLDGEFKLAKDTSCNLYSQTLHYGNGVFEGIRSYATSGGTKIFKAKEHYERLLYSAQKMHIDVKLSVDDFTRITYELLEKNNLTDAYIRPIIYMGVNQSFEICEDVHILITAWKWGKFYGDKQQKVGISSFQRPNPKSVHVEAKVTGHYANSFIASIEAKKNGYDEALLLDMHENIAEAPGANFFMEKNGELHTPALGNILAGITRATIIGLAKNAGIKVTERAINPSELNTADSAFFTGTAAEVVGIESINGNKFPLAWENSIGNKLAAIYQKAVVNEL